MTVGSSAALGMLGAVAGSAPCVGVGSRDEGILREKAFLHFISSLPVPGSHAARQASLSITISQSLLKLMSIQSLMPSNHLVLFSFCLQTF